MHSLALGAPLAVPRDQVGTGLGGYPGGYPDLVVPQAAQCLARAVTARCHATESWVVFMTKEEGREGGGDLRPGEGVSVCRG